MVSNERTTNVYSVSGEVVKSMAVPKVFDTPFRPDVIKKAVVAADANKRQPYGPAKTAGMRHAVSTWGKGRGVARVQRLSQGRTAAESPNNVGGRRAHPPVPEKDWSKKVNKKELALARKSALAAVVDESIVRSRGHRFDEGLTLPLVVEDDIQDMLSTAEVYEAIVSLGLKDDIIRAKDGRKVRAGRGKMRGRRHRNPRSLLLVVSDKELPIFKGAANLLGVEVAAVDSLNASLLAPGGLPGRLTVFTESAMKKIEGW
ncbi:MAG: large subunit ribosomal protein L4e [Candidatus Methanomethylophilaceae archaeon]|nr:large subunit ribosomal protein L4e [Candidatus Methanomethylophilaceae archaeon]MDI3541650.1 large subunit ribosomal protein L4e [Candidatus Methanomethylophilaceae archaeon]HIJ00908.1 50S ribosomal protein L4 [Candidatus Methanomethylophilaceae archaeon]